MHTIEFSQAIASSAPRGNLNFIVSRLPFAPPFDCIVSGEEVAHGKPAPDICLAAAKCLERDPLKCVVFEDAPAGIAAGKAAGCRVIAIAAAFPRDQLAQADLVVTSFNEVLWSEDRWAGFILSGT